MVDKAVLFTSLNKGHIPCKLAASYSHWTKLLLSSPDLDT